MDSMSGKIVQETAKSIPFIPDEVITNILSHLPVRRAMGCRVVCKKWRDLTSNRDFVDLHFKNNSVPLILVVAWREYCRIRLYEFDNNNWWEIATMEDDISITEVYVSENLYKPRSLFSRDDLVLFSHDGLVVFLEESCSFVIVNPIRQYIESVTLTFPTELATSEIYGVYYHPSVKEYCSLCKIQLSSAQPDRFQYKTLTLGSNPSMKTIGNPFSDMAKAKDSIPLLVNNHLYWKLESFQQGHIQDGHNDIMEFDIIREEFTVIPCPIPLNTKCKSYQTHLLNNDGILCFLLLHSNKITIWRLEYDAVRRWTTTEYTFDRGIKFFDRVDKLNVIAVVDGKLAIQRNRILWVCNFMDGTVLNYPEYRVPAHTLFISYRMSLASLCNGKTRIFIDKDDKVVVT